MCVRVRPRACVCACARASPRLSPDARQPTTNLPHVLVAMKSWRESHALSCGCWPAQVVASAPAARPPPPPPAPVAAPAPALPAVRTFYAMDALKPQCLREARAGPPPLRRRNTAGTIDSQPRSEALLRVVRVRVAWAAFWRKAFARLGKAFERLGGSGGQGRCARRRSPSTLAKRFPTAQPFHTLWLGRERA
jgi:hypothetical protein